MFVYFIVQETIFSEEFCRIVHYISPYQTLHTQAATIFKLRNEKEMNNLGPSNVTYNL